MEGFKIQMQPQTCKNKAQEIPFWMGVNATTNYKLHFFFLFANINNGRGCKSSFGVIEHLEFRDSWAERQKSWCQHVIPDSETVHLFWSSYERAMYQESRTEKLQQNECHSCSIAAGGWCWIPTESAWSPTKVIGVPFIAGSQIVTTWRVVSVGGIEGI